ncbi:MAG TPA: hypothetical protein VNJ01_06245 [Bacteriovoracaceae bacterium]|nr:hypothetical protein [Bacteriovoracaceae bacterium]
MKWFILLALFACSSNEPAKPTQDAPAPSPTESNARPVDPLTVEPCYCNKIFLPVCAQGSNYGNSCEAECDGHKTWTEGSCGTKSKK